MDGRIAFGMAVSLVAVGCGPDARSVFDKMHAAACSGDDDKFFAQVAEDKLTDNLVKRARGKTLDSVTTENLVIGTAVLGADNLRSIERSAVLSALEGWRKDISQKRGAGDVCGWSFVSAEKIGEAERADVRSKAGNKKYLYFAKVDGQLKLFDFQPVDGWGGNGVAPGGGNPLSSSTFKDWEVR